jgi:hypothetical protein
MGAKKNWIKGAIKHPGALTRKAKAAGQTVSEYIHEAHKNPTTRREVALAKTLEGFHHKK